MNTDPNNDLMNSDPHERARTMIVLSGAEEVSAAGHSWLALHLESCPPCREFADNSRETIRSLRAIPITASASLVSATQMRVRQRAVELQRQQERLWVICVCCAAVTLSTAVTTTILWRGFAWMMEGQQVRFSSPLFVFVFIALGLMPAMVAGIILLARGTHMADHNGLFQG